MRDVGKRILHEALRSFFIFRMGVQDGDQRVDCVEKPVQLAFLVAFNPGRRIARRVVLDLGNRVFHRFVLIVEIEKHNAQDGNSCHQSEGQADTGCLGDIESKQKEGKQKKAEEDSGLRYKTSV